MKRTFKPEDGFDFIKGAVEKQPETVRAMFDTIYKESAESGMTARDFALFFKAMVNNPDVSTYDFFLGMTAGVMLAAACDPNVEPNIADFLRDRNKSKSVSYHGPGGEA
jgi:hypothetical protein